MAASLHPVEFVRSQNGTPDGVGAMTGQGDDNASDDEWGDFVRDSNTSDEEWGDFVAPEPSVAPAGVVEDVAWDVYVSNYVNGSKAPLGNMYVAADVAFDHVAAAVTSTTGRGPAKPNSDNIAFHDDLFLFDEVPVVTSAHSPARLDEPTDAHGQNALGIAHTTARLEATAASSPLDLLGDGPPWDLLNVPESDVVKPATTAPQSGHISDEVDENDFAVDSELEDESLWDWVAAETSDGPAKDSDAGIANKLGDLSLSGSQPVVVSNGAADRDLFQEETGDQGLSPSLHLASGGTSNGAVIGASVDKGTTLLTQVEEPEVVNTVNVRNTAAPLPLSLFEEDAVDKDPLLDAQLELTLDSKEAPSSSINRTQSLDLAASNFSDLIASLYPDQHTPGSNSSKRTSHRRSRSTSIQASTAGDVEFFFSQVDAHPLQPQHSADGESLQVDAGIMAEQGAMPNGDGTSEDEAHDDAAPGSQISSPSQGKGLGYHAGLGLEDILRMDVHSVLNESVSLEDIYLGGFCFQYRDERGLETNLIKPIDVDDRGNDRISALQKLTFSLISEGRVREAHRCKQHTAAVSGLPHLQEAYSDALESGEFEKAAATAKEIEVARTNLAKAEDLKQWQSRQRHVLNQSAHEQVSGGGLSVITIDEMTDLLGKSNSDARAVVLMSLFDALEVSRLAESDLEAAVGHHARAIHTFRVLACASKEEQVACVTTWNQLASVCALELEHAQHIWQIALNADAQTRLLDTPQGKSFFAAVGQIYVVSCVLSATLKVYEPWLAVAKNEGQTTSEAIERCHKVWLDSTLKDAVRLSLVSSVHTLPMTAASWVEIQKLPRAAKTAIIQAAGRSTSDRSSARFCGLSLLPLLPFTAIPAVEWEGRHYLLPLANLWANTISAKPPGLPVFRIGELRATC